jgi:hypothetical protein
MTNNLPKKNKIILTYSQKTIFKYKKPKNGIKINLKYIH